MNRKKIFAQVVVVLLSSVVGVNLGNGILRIANAKEKPAAKRAAKAKTKTAGQGIKPPVASCPTIKVPPLSIFAEDYSSNETLGTRHGDVESASIEGLVSGLPDGTSAEITLTFQLSINQSAQSSTDPKLLSIAISGVDVYLAGAGSNFLIQGYDLTSQVGVMGHIGNPLPTGTLQYNATVFNGSFNITAILQAGAITDQMASASSIIALDLIDVSFTNGSTSFSSNKKNITNFSKQCPSKCDIYYDDINRRVDDLINQYDALVADKQNLYCVARCNPAPFGTDGTTWKGHLIKYNQAQNGLKNQIRLAQNLGCVIPIPGNVWANTDPPDHPANPKCPITVSPCPL